MMTTSRISRNTSVLLSYLALALLTVFTCLISRFLVINSHFRIDFENLLVFPLSSYLYLGGIISLSLLLFGATTMQIKWVEKQKASSQMRLLSLIVASLFSGGILALIPANPSIFWTTVGISSYMVLADLFINPKEQNLTWLISWVIILSGFMSMVLFDGYLKYDELQRKQLAQSLVHHSDQIAVQNFERVKESLLDECVFEQFLSVPFPFKIHRDEFRKVNKQIFHPSGNKKYQYTFNAYDRLGNPMIYETYTALSYFQDFSQRSDTLADNIFYDPIKNAYLAKWTQEIANHENSPFTVYLEQYPSEMLLAEASNIVTGGDLGKYEYAYYKNGRLASYSSPYILDPADSWKKMTLGESHIVTDNSYSSLYLQVGEEELIKLSRKSARLIKPVSLFSFIFLYISLILALLASLNRKFRFLPRNFLVDFGRISSLKNKLQFSIIALIIFSFIIIGVVTIYYFQNLSGQYDKDLSKEKAIALSMDLQAKTRHMVNADMMIHSLSKQLSQICKKHHVDINIYESNGELALSSFPKAYEKNKMKPLLRDDILGAFAQNRNQIKLEFQSADLGADYQQAYFPILKADDDISIIVHSLQVPVIKSNSKVSDFVGTLLNIYVFLFLIAGALALAVSNSITQPLKNLGQKIKKLKLGSKNEPLDWQSEDEIGQLVSNYNEMVGKLDDSAKLIAHTERDLAWREMAKQVAHEIKNPLTPMKLSIQYLQRAIDQQPERTTELVDRVSSTLIEQIDNLSNIAGAFSNFGKMPQSQNEKIVLNEIVEAIHDLFRKRNDMDVNMYEPIDELYVFADKNALIRVLNNIVKNAIQAIPTERRGHIDIKLFKKDKLAIVKISDNGIGIPDERKDKVFLPNFTTKSSGTGLGLAICANMVESFNGRMYFRSTQGVGTDFFVEIPLMHVNDNFEEQERVVLD